MIIEFYFNDNPTECVYDHRSVLVPRRDDTVQIDDEPGIFQVVEVRWCYSAGRPNHHVIKVMLGRTYPTALDRPPLDAIG